MKRQYLFLLTVFAIGISIIPRTTLAEIRYVVSKSSLCPAGDPTPPCYTNLAEAIAAAVDNDSIEIRPGTYVGNFTINKKVSIYGKETARTFLSGGGSGTILTITGVTDMSVRNLSFINAAAGIVITNSSSIDISNNIFEINDDSIQIDSTSSTHINNNVFYLGKIGINSALSSLVIKNNIFHGQSTQAISSNVAPGGVQYNLFFSTTAGPLLSYDSTDGNIRDQDPEFVNVSSNDPTKRDFHLTSYSPAINKGDTSEGFNKVGDTTKTDIGAFGGGQSDTIPYPVSDLHITASTESSISLSWSSNNSYLTAGYFVYFGSASRTYGSPEDAGLATSYTLTTTSVISQPTGTPILTNSVTCGTLLLTWDTRGVKDATGYEVFYDIVSPPTNSIDVGNTSVYPLAGLTDGTHYFVHVFPYADSTIYIAVAVYYSNKSFVSDYSNEVNRSVGDRLYGATHSNEIEDYPECLSAQPNLPNKGCFIATAAYGYYSAPQVQALREFRDRYLITNSPGRAFVDWYYRYGPIGADFINNHAWLKPAVRMALLPAVGGALFMVQTTMPIKMVVFGLLGLLPLYLVRKKMTAWRGGTR